MKRIILLAILLHSAFGILHSRAQVVTNDATLLTNRTWSLTVAQPWYLRVVAVQGATPLDLTDRRVVWTVRHIDTEALILSSTGTIHSANPGEIIFRWTPTAAGTFSAAATITRTDTGESIAPILADTLTVTSAPSAGGGSASVNIASGAVQVAVQAGVTGNTFEVTAGDVIASGTVTIPSITVDNTTIITGVVGIAVSTNDAPASVTTNEDGVATINIPPSTGGTGGGGLWTNLLNYRIAGGETNLIVTFPPMRKIKLSGGSPSAISNDYMAFRINGVVNSFRREYRGGLQGTANNAIANPPMLEAANDSSSDNNASYVRTVGINNTYAGVFGNYYTFDVIGGGLNSLVIEGWLRTANETPQVIHERFFMFLTGVVWTANSSITQVVYLSAYPLLTNNQESLIIDGVPK